MVICFTQFICGGRFFFKPVVHKHFCLRPKDFVNAMKSFSWFSGLLTNDEGSQLGQFIFLAIILNRTENIGLTKFRNSS